MGLEPCPTQAQEPPGGWRWTDTLFALGLMTLPMPSKWG